MRLVRGLLITDAELAGFLVIGDGHHDEVVMRALLEKFDHGRAVLMPQDRPSLGLEGSVRAAAELIGRFGRDVLVVIDRERFDDGRFNRHVREYFMDRKVKVDADDFKHVWARRGSRWGNLYVAIMGREKALEENLAILIREVFRTDVEPTKEGVRDFLRRRGLHVADLIRRAGRAKLRTAFPRHLIRLLEEWSGEEGRMP